MQLSNYKEQTEINLNYLTNIYIYTPWAVKKFLEFPCKMRMRDKIAHTLLWWGARHVCSEVQQVWTRFALQCRYSRGHVSQPWRT
jgi:hypothetical protein